MILFIHTDFHIQNRTRGLFGNWSFDQSDDFALPDGLLVQPNTYDFESVHKQYASNCEYNENNIVIMDQQNLSFCVSQTNMN